MTTSGPSVVDLATVGMDDVVRVGGKNASLGELIRHLEKAGVRVARGFATTVAAYWRLLEANGLERAIADEIAVYRSGAQPLAAAGKHIRRRILDAEWPPQVRAQIAAAYRKLSAERGVTALDTAVRSSATAEDPCRTRASRASTESFLNVRGEAQLLDACRGCIASLYTDRAISYRSAASG